MGQKILEEICFDIVNNIDDGILVINYYGEIIDANNIVYDMFEYSETELIGQSIEILVPDEYQKNHKKDRNNFFKKPMKRPMAVSKGKNRELFAQTKNNKILSVVVSLTPINYNGETVAVAIVRDNTEKKHQSDLIKQFSEILDKAFDEIYIFEHKTLKIVQANKGALDNIGYSISELRQMDLFDIQTDFEKLHFKKIIDKLNTKPDLIYETTQKRKDKTKYPVEVRLQTSIIEDEKFLIAVVLNIEEKKRAEEVLKEKENYLRTLIDTTPECIMVLGADSIFLDINPIGVDMLKLESKDICLGRKFIDFIKDEDIEKFLRVHNKTLFDGKTNTIEIFLNIKGKKILVEINLAPLIDSTGNIGAILAIMRDITERKKADDAIKKLVYKDPLTGLYNRRSFDETLKLQTAKYNRSHDTFAMMVIDLDDFGTINNTLGHQSGDKLLTQIAKRLKKQFKRETDFVARYGGDEFIVIISGLRSIGETDQMVIQKCKDIAQNLVSIFEEPYMFNDTTLTITTSIGVSLCMTSDEITPDEILRRADEAMYKAKKSGKDNFFMHPVT